MLCQVFEAVHPNKASRPLQVVARETDCSSEPTRDRRRIVNVINSAEAESTSALAYLACVSGGGSSTTPSLNWRRGLALTAVREARTCDQLPPESVTLIGFELDIQRHMLWIGVSRSQS